MKGRQKQCYRVEEEIQNQEKGTGLVGRNICKSYGSKQVLTNVDIEIRPGCIYGLLGRNGIGKTTLLGILTAQKTMTSGEVTYEGMPVWENRRALKELCLTGQIVMGSDEKSSQGTHISDYFWIASTYLVYWNQSYAEELLEQFGLNKKQRLNKLSKGQSSMLAIIVGLASGAPITILDEPVAGVDIIARELFYQLLLEEHQRSGRTFVISTHIIEEAQQVFERVMILTEEGIVEDKDTQELVGEFCQVTGAQTAIQSIIAEDCIFNRKYLGEQMIAIVRGTPEQFLRLEAKGLHVTAVTLQQVFVAICGM